MIKEIGYALIFGKSLVVYLGILTFLSLLVTAYMGFSLMKGRKWASLKKHKTIAFATILLATIHGLLVFLAYF